MRILSITLLLFTWASNLDAQVFAVENYSDSITLRGRLGTGLQSLLPRWFGSMSLVREPGWKTPGRIEYTFIYSAHHTRSDQSRFEPYETTHAFRINYDRAHVRVEQDTIWHTLMTKLGSVISGSFEFTPIRTGRSGIGIHDLNIGYCLSAAGKLYFVGTLSGADTCQFTTTSSIVFPDGSHEIHLPGNGKSSSPFIVDLTFDPTPRLGDTCTVTCRVIAKTNTTTGFDVIFSVDSRLKLVEVPLQPIRSIPLRRTEFETFSFKLLPLRPSMTRLTVSIKTFTEVSPKYSTGPKGRYGVTNKSLMLYFDPNTSEFLGVGKWDGRDLPDFDGKSHKYRHMIRTNSGIDPQVYADHGHEQLHSQWKDFARREEVFRTITNSRIDSTTVRRSSKYRPSSEQLEKSTQRWIRLKDSLKKENKSDD